MIKWKQQSNLNIPIQRNPEILMPDMRLRKINPGLRNDTYTTGLSKKKIFFVLFF